MERQYEQKVLIGKGNWKALKRYCRKLSRRGVELGSSRAKRCLQGFEDVDNILEPGEVN